jgi:hypothetical protein
METGLATKMMMIRAKGPGSGMNTVKAQGQFSLENLLAHSTSMIVCSTKDGRHVLGRAGKTCTG